jgi:transposase InsO family protein
MALDRSWDTGVGGAHAPGVGTREPRASAATSRVEGSPLAAATDGDGPNLLGSAIETVDKLAAFVAAGGAGDRGPLAPGRISTLLGMEESTTSRSARNQYGGARSDSTDEPANPRWGAPRIHGELLKLGLTVSEATVSKYMVRPRRPPSQVWRAFLKNHARELIALDFFTVPTATFRVLFVAVVLSYGRRRLVHFNVTEHPTADWTARQVLEAVAVEKAPRYLVRDRDQVYGGRFSRQAKTLDIREVVIAPRSPWQNAYAERVIGSIRRECLDHVVVIGERHFRRILSTYVDYYNRTRTHLSLTKDSPEPRSVQRPSQGRVVSVPRVGGLHHEYLRRAA